MNFPKFILNIETATKNCSVSISKDGKLVALKEFCETNFSHAEKLTPFIHTVLAESKLTLKNLSAIAIGKGPGSFTGLRIGVSAAKGLCFGLDIPLISIPTMEILANATKVNNGFIIPLLDARRQEVYTAVFNKNHEFVKKTFNTILEKNSFATYLEKDTVVFLGDGSTKTKEIIKHKNAIFLDQYNPSAREMTKLAFQKFKGKEFENIAYFEPFYLKDFYTTVSKKN
ncbi:MAG: tRNA (adenosine(37)-N6)-threonylcarbamoyltransferase complex dimerization subunit type 1 TsaB [Flavobacteriaceae bacterium]|nr:tRNA (adenosine(37)-N6)-threonylcarbamoyltransferase complex dimerization subunit type 1 TsaB [Flavobacteriaceae bacterium]